MKIYKNNIIYIAAVVIICVAGLSAWFLPLHAPTNTGLVFKTIKIGEMVIRGEVAATPKQQIQGLSDRNFLATSTGMFFVFDYSARWGIWMKDMRFPIDVLWITDDLKVGDIVENMLPSSYPNDYLPKTLVRYVLEVPAGTVKNYGIVVGQDVVVK